MPVTVAPVNLERLSRRFAALQLRFAALQGQAEARQVQKAKLTRDISLAKARIELAPQVVEVFDYMQEKAHAEAVGDFEELLSAFVADVEPEAGQVRLELGTERGAPALDIMLDNGGDLENILEGNGGGVTNVVVTGLGYSALSRTANRQLMLLDEPDCWLQAKNVPNFTKVIAEVANPRVDADGAELPGCQTLMISHNDLSLMDDGAHIQKVSIDRDAEAFAARLGTKVVYKGDVSECAYVVWVAGAAGAKGHVEVRYRNDGLGDDDNNALTKGFPFIESIGGARAWSDEMAGVRWVEVVNLRRHVFTRMGLSSGLNVLTGGINSGKSTLYFTALRAMAYGETDDTMIRHGADSAVVRIGLENDVVLEMVRSRKGAPKVLYRRFDAGVMVNEGRQETKGSVPSFITEVLKIQRVDDLDIQLRSQKQPVFLLNETAPRRAQLLSVGRESGLLQALIERHRLQNRRDKEQAKRDEVELNQVNRTLMVLAPLGSVSALMDVMDALMEDARDIDARLQATAALVARFTPLESRAKLLECTQDMLAAAPVAPALTPSLPVVELIARIARTRDLASLPDMPQRPVQPMTHDTGALQRLFPAFHKGLEAATLLAYVPTAPTAPALAATDSMHRLLAGLHRGQHAEQMCALLPVAPHAPQLADTSSISRVVASLHHTQHAAVLSAVVPDAPPAPSIFELAELRRDGALLAQRQQAVAELEKEEPAAVADAKDADEALHTLKHELGVCPTCNQAFQELSHV